MELEPKKPWWRDSIIIFMRASSWVFIPVLIALFLGKYLDKRYGTKPWVFLSFTAVAFAISLFGIVRTTLRGVKKIEDEQKKKKLEENGEPK